jgi:NADH-quinone oxidoreductase subunit G
VIVLAGDLREDLPVLHLRLRAAAANDGLVIIDCSPVPTALAEAATASLLYRPGESVSLARGLAGASAADVPGVPAERLARARTALGEALESASDGSGIVVVVGRSSLAESAEQIAGAVAVLAEAWPGARFLPALRRANVLGALDMGLAPGILPGRVRLDEGAEWYTAAWGSVPTRRGLDTAGMLEAAVNAEIGTLILLGADPLADFPDRSLAKQALEAVPYLVAIDALASPSSRLADVVLPAAMSIERAGSTTNIEGRVTRLAQKVVPPGQARPDWIIAVELAGLLGKATSDLGFESVDEIWEEIERLAPSHRGCRLSALLGAAGGDGVVVPVAATTVTPRRIERLDPMATPGITSVGEQGAPLYSGAVLEPDALGDAVAGAGGEDEDAGAGAGAGGTAASPAPPRPALMTFRPGDFVAPTSPPPDGYAYRLVTRRSLYDQGTLLQAAPSLGSLAPIQALRLRTKEIEQLGVRQGDDVRVRSLSGELIVPVVADDALPAGVAVLPFGVVPVGQPSAADLLDVSAIVSHVRVETLL